MTCASVRAIADAVPVDPWDVPKPLRVTIERVPYPLDALPDLLREAVVEVQGYVQSPPAMVACSALSALATAVQAHFDVARDATLTGPSSLYFLVLGDSGERKTSGEGYFSLPITEYETDQRAAAGPVLRDYASTSKAHAARVNGLLDAMRRLARDGKPTAAKQQEHADLEADEPKRPRVPRLLLTDATPEGLTYTLATDWPSGIVATDEGGAVFGGHAMGKDAIMRNLATLNTLWDAKPVRVTRRTSESYVVAGARLSIAIQVQPVALQAFIEQSGTLARGSGWFARFLIGDPESTQGTRAYRAPPATWPALTRYQERLREVLRWPVKLTDTGGLQPVTLLLDPDARAAWIAMHDGIEAGLAHGGELAAVRDVAAKAADNIARVAVHFEVASCEGRPVSIGRDAVERAGRVVAWHLHEAQRYFGELSISDEQRNAARLDDWLAAECVRTGDTETTRRDAQHRGPNPTRNRDRLDGALAMLEEHGRVRLVAESAGKVRVQVHPKLIAAARAAGGTS